MSINIPSNRTEVVDKVKTDVQTELPTSEPFLPNSYISALCTGFGGRIFDVYENLSELLKQCFPQTATGDFLQRWGNLKNVFIITPEPAEGTIVVTGSAGIPIPDGTTFVSSNTQQYTTVGNGITSVNIVSAAPMGLTSSGTLATFVSTNPHNLATGMTVTISGASPTTYNGTFTIICINLNTFTYTLPTTASSPATGTISASYTGTLLNVTSFPNLGSATNQPSGAQLTIGTPIVGLSNTAYVAVSGIVGGADQESDDAYRLRVLFKWQNPHSLFNAAEIESTVLSLPGITRAFIFPSTPLPGSVTVYFTRDNDTSIIPDGSQVLLVYLTLQEIMPVDMNPDNLIVKAPVAQPVPFSFQSLTPNTQNMQNAIEANLNAFFREANSVSTPIQENLYKSVIQNTIDINGNQLQTFILNYPTGNIPVAIGNIGTYTGTSIYPDIPS